MTKTTKITASTFQGFIASNEICVIRAKTSVDLDFNKTLNSQLTNKFKSSVNIGWLDINIDKRNTSIHHFITSAIPSIGLPFTKAIFPGYYLFKNGKLLAYHPGTLSQAQMNPQETGIAMLSAAIAGLFVGISTKDTLKGLETYLEYYEAPTGLRIFQFFLEVLNGKGFTSSKSKQEIVFEDELCKAYKLLNVSPHASDQEIKAARNRAILEVHPDKNPGDKEALNKLSAEINAAYDLIKKTRKAKKENAVVI